jgi:hypothetical protein
MDMKNTVGIDFIKPFYNYGVIAESRVISWGGSIGLREEEVMDSDDKLTTKALSSAAL